MRFFLLLLLSVFSVSLAWGQTSREQQLADSLIAEAEKLETVEERLEYYLKMIDEHIHTKGNMSLALCSKAIQSFDNSSLFTYTNAKIASYASMLYAHRSIEDSTFFCGNLALEIADSLTHKEKLKVEHKVYKAYAYFYIDNKTTTSSNKSIEYSLKAIDAIRELTEITSDKKQKNRLLSQYALSYSDLASSVYGTAIGTKEKVRAKQYFKKSIEIAKSKETKVLMDSLVISRAYSILATNIFWTDIPRQTYLDSAKSYFKLAMLYAKNHPSVLASATINLGIFYEEQLKDYNKALYNYHIGLTNIRKVNEQEANALMNIGASHILLGNIDSAKYYFDTAKVMAVQGNNRRILTSMLNLQANYYLKKENHKEASAALIKLRNLQDSVYLVEKEGLRQDLLEKYESEKKDREIAFQKLEREKAEQEKQLFLLGGGGLSLSLLLVAAFFVQRSRTRRKEKDRAEAEYLQAQKNLEDEIRERQKAENLRNEVQAELQQAGQIREELNTHLEELSTLFSNLGLELLPHEQGQVPEKLLKFQEVFPDEYQKLESIHSQSHTVKKMADEQGLSMRRLESILATEGAFGTSEGVMRFEIQADRAYPGLTQRLKEEYPEVTPALFRLFVLLKMGKTQSQCVEILSKDANTLKKRRARLREALGLKGSSQKLEDFIKAY